jgi:hypothetical protein
MSSFLATQVTSLGFLSQCLTPTLLSSQDDAVVPAVGASGWGRGPPKFRFFRKLWYTAKDLFNSHKDYPGRWQNITL